MDILGFGGFYNPSQIFSGLLRIVVILVFSQGTHPNVRSEADNDDSHLQRGCEAGVKMIELPKAGQMSYLVFDCFRMFSDVFLCSLLPFRCPLISPLIFIEALEHGAKPAWCVHIGQLGTSTGQGPEDKGEVRGAVPGAGWDELWETPIAGLKQA